MLLDYFAQRYNILIEYYNDPDLMKEKMKEIPEDYDDQIVEKSTEFERKVHEFLSGKPCSNAYHYAIMYSHNILDAIIKKLEERAQIRN